MRVLAISKKSNIQHKPVAKRFKHFRDNLELSLLALPAIILVFIFSYLPMFGVVIAFKDFRYDKGFFGSKWVGFKNFEFFFQSQDAWRITRNTIGLNAIFIVTGLIVSVSIALMLYEITNRFFVKTYQTIMIFPHFLSWVVVGYMFFAFFNVEHGLINGLLKMLGREVTNWYTEPAKWPAILTIANIWKSAGWNSVIYYAALMGIDQEYFEAATIDGASKFQVIKNITIPFLVPIMTILTILAIGGIFRADFGMFYYLTRESGPLFPTTDVIDTYVYRSLRTLGDIGMSSAVGLYQSVVGFVLVLVTNLIVRKIDPESALF